MKGFTLTWALLGVALGCSSKQGVRHVESDSDGGVATNGATGTPSTSMGGGASVGTTGVATSTGDSGAVTTSMGGASSVTSSNGVTSMGGGTTTVAAGGTTTTDTGAGGSGGGGCDTLSEAIDQGGSYVLAFGDTYFAAVPAGGKIVEFRRSAGSNLLTANDLDATNFGSTLWTSPQADWDWPPPTELDSDPYTVLVDDAAGTITMTSGVSTSVGPMVSVQKVFAADLCGGAVDITYTVTNESGGAASFGAWEVSRTFAGGLGFFPGSRRGYDSDVLPATEMDGLIWFDHQTQSTSGSKMFADGSGGYVAFTDGTDLFVRAFSDVAQGSQAPEHGEVEVYDGDTYVEYEVQGAYGSVAAGASASLQVRWLVRPFPTGAVRETGNQELVNAVMGLL